MSSKRNNDDFFKLFIGIFFGILAIILLAFILIGGGFSGLFVTIGGSGPESGVPILFLIIIGLVVLYYAIKKILKTNKNKNDT